MRRLGVLLSDIGMPGMDGYALVRKIRQMQDARRIASPSSAPALQLHITKPVDPGELMAALERLGRRAAL